MFLNWRTAYDYRLKANKSQLFHELLSLKKVFTHLKSEALRSMKLRILLQSFDRERRLLRSIFDQVRLTVEQRKQAKHKKKWGATKPPLSAKSKSTEKVTKKRPQELDAILVRSKFLKSQVFESLQSYSNERKRLRYAKAACEQMASQNLLKRYMRSMLETFVIQPQLDEIGDLHFLKRNF